MRNGPNRPAVRPGTVLPAAFAGLVLVACSTIESSLGPIGTPSNPQIIGEGESTLITNQTMSTADIDCPTVTVRSGASAWQVSAGPGPTNVRYQGSIGQLARECALLGETITMRVGVEGRILVGPQGGPGNVNVPIRIALVAEGPQPKSLWTKFYDVPVNVPPGASQSIFSQVEDDLTFPLPANRKIDHYVVYVGFDPQGAAKTAAKPKPAAPRPAAPKTVAAPKPAAPKTTPSQQPQFESPPGNVFAPPPGRRGGGASAPPPSGNDVFAPPPGHKGG